MKYELWKSKADEKWYWHLKAANGEKIAQGEGYSRKVDCEHAIGLVRSSGVAPVINLTPTEKDS